MQVYTALGIDQPIASLYQEVGKKSDHLLIIEKAAGRCRVGIQREAQERTAIDGAVAGSVWIMNAGTYIRRIYISYDIIH